ncbi:MAG: hypothetical protein RR585_04540 [Coprobacillus sp.]
MSLPNCKRIDEVKEEKLLVIKILRGEGTKDDLCRHVNQYYRRLESGDYIILFEEDPCKMKKE